MEKKEAKEKIFIIVGAIVIFVVVLLVKAALKPDDIIKEKLSPSINFKKSVNKIFGVPKNILDSGVASAKYSEHGSTINYNFFAFDYTDFDKELGNDLAPRIKEIYKSLNTFNRITFNIFLPFIKRNNFWWKHVLTFDFDREIFEKIR